MRWAKGMMFNSAAFHGHPRKVLIDLLWERDEELEGKYDFVNWKGRVLYAEGFAPSAYGGEGAFLQATVSALLDGDGNIVGAIESDRDITERKRMEEEKKEVEQRAQMASRLATVGEMASGAAHEINNPLVGVIGFAQLLMEREDMPEDAREELEIIYNGGQRVASIVKRLLSFARQGKPEKSYVSVNELVEATLELRSYEMKTANIEIDSQLDPDLPWTMADAGQLQQVFLNIILNAEQAISLTHGRGKLTVRTELKDETIRISFKDDGPGIAKENIEKVFNPFFTTREVGQGAGLGLSICHGIIAEHRGQIYVRSRLGKGTTFVVGLPVIAAEEQVEVTEEIGEVGKAKILVVDDEPINLKYLSQVLGGEGHEVDTVDNGADALGMVKKGNYDLVLTDIKMPGMSGIELYRSLQEAMPSSASKVVFITGDVMGAETQAFLSRSAAPRVSKPFDNKQLKEVINRVLTKTGGK